MHVVSGLSQRFRFYPAHLLTAILILLYAVWSAETLQAPGLARFDEFLSLQRTRSVLESGDPFAVYNNSEPNMNKPPLQYWMGAALMTLGLSDELSLRLGPLMFGVGVFLLTALCAQHLRGEEDPWVGPAAVGFLGSSLLFVEHMRTAMLETGLCFFVMAALYSLWRAQHSPRWWLAWGVLCGLGALQKAPMALLASVVCGIVIYAGSLERLKETFQDKSFQVGCCLNLLLTGFWPLIQTLRFGTHYRDTITEQGIRRFTVGLEGHSQTERLGLHLERLLYLTIDSSVFWLLCALTLFASVFWYRYWLQDRKILGCLMFTVFVLSVIVVAAGPIYQRYILVFTPLMTAVTATGISRITGRVWVGLLLALCCLTYQSDRLPLGHYQGATTTRASLRAAARIYRGYLEPGKPGLTLFPPHHKPVVAAEIPFGKQSLAKHHVVLELPRYTALVYQPILDQVLKRFEVVTVKRRLANVWIVEVSPRRKGQLLGSYPEGSPTNKSQD